MVSLVIQRRCDDKINKAQTIKLVPSSKIVPTSKMVPASKVVPTSKMVPLI